MTRKFGIGTTLFSGLTNYDDISTIYKSWDDPLSRGHRLHPGKLGGVGIQQDKAKQGLKRAVVAFYVYTGGGSNIFYFHPYLGK